MSPRTEKALEKALAPMPAVERRYAFVRFEEARHATWQSYAKLFLMMLLLHEPKPRWDKRLRMHVMP